MKTNQPILAFNRGIVSPLSQARIDIERINVSAEIQTNWMPRRFGSMMLRPGLKYTGSTHNNNKALHIPFIFSKDDTAILEFTDSILRIKINEEPITRLNSGAVVTNPSFFSNLTGWTDNDESGGVSSWSSDFNGSMLLRGDGTQAARRTQLVTLINTIEHALSITVERGPIILKVGSTSGGDDYISESILGTGYHSLSFTPTTDFYIDISSRVNRDVYISSIDLEADGIMTLPTPYTEDLLSKIRKDQSADIIYLACEGVRPMKIERRGIGRSWSIVDYLPEDGPFKIGNVSEITMTPGALFGNTTLTASKSYFRSSNVGSLFKLISSGQVVTKSISTANDFTDEIEVTGTDSSRVINIVVTGTFTATWHLQRSFDGGASWLDVTSGTAPTATSFNDGLNNSAVLYKLGVKTGNYTSGTLLCSLVYSSGSNIGICRVTSYVSETVVNVEVLNNFGNTTATFDWAEGEWSERRGFPSAVCLGEGRLCWAGKSKFIASVSDAFESFSDEIEGDAGTISYNLGSGSVDSVSWMISLYRIFIGTQTSEKNIKTSSFEEPITPTNFKIVNLSYQGSSDIDCAKLDTRCIFAQSGGVRLYEISYNTDANDYLSSEISDLCPEIGLPSISKIAIQRHPDTRIHIVKSDGKAGILVYESSENLKCWINIETDGIIEDVITLPGDVEDKVYYCIRRIINGLVVRYLEKWSLENECQGGSLNKQADSFLEYSGTSTPVITGLSHLEGREVVVWGDGKDLGVYTVNSGSITLPQSVANCIVGLGYTAQYKSMKLAYASQSPLNQKKRVNQLGAVLYKTHYQGLKYGLDFDNLDNLPLVENGKTQLSDTVYETYDQETFEFEGSWDTDARICLQAQAPRPCTLLAVTFQISTNDKG